MGSLLNDDFLMTANWVDTEDRWADVGDEVAEVARSRSFIY